MLTPKVVELMKFSSKSLVISKLEPHRTFIDFGHLIIVEMSSKATGLFAFLLDIDEIEESKLALNDVGIHIGGK